MNEFMKERAYRAENELYRFYEPCGKLQEFYNLAGSGKYLVAMISAANGVGKTASGANALANLIWPCQNKYWQHPLWLNWPYPKRIRIASDKENVKGNLLDEMEKWFPRGRYTKKKGDRLFDSIWETDTGWRIDILTYDQEPKQFESATIGLVWLDEPPPKSVYKACVSRLRKGGLMFITQTPLSGSAFLYDEIMDNPDNEDGYRTFAEATVEDACIDHGVNGHLKHEDILRMVAQYDDDDKQARIYGKFQHLVGLVFKQWNRKIHVVEPFQINKNEFTVYEALDTHPRNPDACLWLAVNEKNQYFVVDELYMKGTTEALVDNIKKKAFDYNVQQRFLEPAAFVEDQHTGKSLAGMIAGQGLYYEKATKMRDASNRRIMDALSYQEVKGAMIRAPEIYVFSTCKRMIYEIEHYQWDEWTTKTAEKRNPNQKPMDRDDHMIEDLGRLLIQEPRFRPYINPEEWGQITQVQQGRVSDPYETVEQLKRRVRDPYD